MRTPLLNQQLLEPTNFVQWLPSCDIIYHLGGIELREKAIKMLKIFTLLLTKYGSDVNSNASGSFEDNGVDSQLSEGIR